MDACLKKPRKYTFPESTSQYAWYCCYVWCHVWCPVWFYVWCPVRHPVWCYLWHPVWCYVWCCVCCYVWCPVWCYVWCPVWCYQEGLYQLAQSNCHDILYFLLYYCLYLIISSSTSSFNTYRTFRCPYRNQILWSVFHVLNVWTFIHFDNSFKICQRINQEFNRIIQQNSREGTPFWICINQISYIIAMRAVWCTMCRAHCTWNVHGTNDHFPIQDMNCLSIHPVHEWSTQ